MKNVAKADLFVWVALISVGAWLRVLLQDLPNVAPVIAVAMMAAVYFRQAGWAWSVPILTMAISDVFLGSYHGGLMLVNYAMLALPVVCRHFLKRHCSLGAQNSEIAAMAKFVGCAAVASVLFFVVTNFAFWCFFDMYPRTLVGLTQCYIQALPFFRYSFLGDFVFAASIYSIYLGAHVWLTSDGQVSAVRGLRK
ncbi:MAG: hypothetical protein MK179_00745 [Pirellulaceae bacterium]|nr:hypothetical protein [Pirellulaceae bacterium]